MGILNVTLNPNDAGSGFTFNNGNLTFGSSTDYMAVRATHSKTTGKWYWEVKFDSGYYGSTIGISNKSFPVTSYSVVNTNWRSYYLGSGNRKFPEGTTYGSAWVVGDIIGVALDLDIGTLEFYKNGVSMGISHTNVKELGEVYPTLASYSTQVKTLTINFGATPFVYSAPTGFLPYNISAEHKILVSSEDEIYSVVPEVIVTETAVPQMTSNTAPSGRAFASSIASTTYDAWTAFDGTDSRYFGTTNGSGGAGHLGYEFVNPIKISKYAVRSYSVGFSPKDWTFEGSNDGNNWTVLDTQVNQIWTTGKTDKEYVINKIGSYKMYRLNWTTNNGQSNTIISELKMFEMSLFGGLIKLPNQSEQTFINHGMNKETSIDLTSKITERRYIVQDNAELGSGKVIKQKIDTSKIPIKNAMIE